MYKSIVSWIFTHGVVNITWLQQVNELFGRSQAGERRTWKFAQLVKFQIEPNYQA